MQDDQQIPLPENPISGPAKNPRSPYRFVIIPIVALVVLMVLGASLLLHHKQEPGKAETVTSQIDLENAPTFREDQAGATKRYAAMNGFLDKKFPVSKKYGPEKSGNFHTSGWCIVEASLPTDKKCQYYEPSVELPGQSIRISQLSYDFKEMFGYEFGTTSVTADEALGLQFSFSESGSTISGPGLSLDYAITDKDSGDYFESYANKHVVSLGSTLDYTTDSNVSISVATDAATVQEELDRYLKTEHDFLSYSLSREDQLQKKVEMSIANNQVTKKGNCRYSRSSGNIFMRTAEAAVPPKCDDVQLSEQEKSAELDKARLEFAARKEFIQQNYKDMHKLAVDKIFWQECPACWGA